MASKLNESDASFNKEEDVSFLSQITDDELSQMTSKGIQEFQLKKNEDEEMKTRNAAIEAANQRILETANSITELIKKEKEASHACGIAKVNAALLLEDAVNVARQLRSARREHEEAKSSKNLLLAEHEKQRRLEVARRKKSLFTAPQYSSTPEKKKIEFSASTPKSPAKKQK